MPPGKPSLAAEDYVNITAFILQFERRRRRRAGADGDARRRRSARSRPASAPATAAPRPRPGAGGGGDGAPRPLAAQPSRGHSVTGEVKNYVPVTDAMLRNPPPGDWLMARRNYQAWSYSPLDEITHDNVKELRLAWSWAMNEAGVEPADAARAQRHHVSRQHRQHDAGARRRDRRADLGKPGRSATRFAASARCATSRSTATRSHGDQRRAPGRVRRAHRQGRWDVAIADPTQRLHQLERPDRRATAR